MDTSPLFVVHGSHAIEDHLRRRLPHNRRWEIEGASHGLVASDADACWQALQAPVSPADATPPGNAARQSHP